MNNQLFQSNLLTLREIYTRTELWKDKIYYISNNPYKFPKNDGNADFLPLPKRFTEIITEFREAIDKLKDQETPQETIQQAQEQIPQIIQDIKEIIQQEITNEEETPVVIELEPEAEEEENQADQEFIQNAEKEKQERIKNLKLGLKKTSPSQFRKFNQEYLENNEEIDNLIEEWEELKKIVKDRKNICFILEDTDQYLRFVFQPPKRIFVNLKDFIFYRNNIWYEVLDWERVNHENVIIIAQRSFFIHNYSQFFRQGANGILHHYPKFGNKDEICQCPAFLESTEFIEFTSDWQPEYKLFKLKNFMGGTWQTELHNKPYGQDKKYPVFHTLDLEEVSGMETQGYVPTTYFLLPEWYEKGNMSKWKEFDIKFFNHTNTSLEEWTKRAKMERMNSQGEGGQYEHLLKHVNVNYFWNDKKIHESTLDEMDWERFKVVVRANPAGIMYRFKSHKVLFRYSEDLNFSLEADRMIGLAAKMGTRLLDGAIKNVSGIDPNTKGIADDLKDTTDKYLHNKKDDKSKDERQGERKKTLAAGNSHIAQTTLGSISSILDASHTHGNYSLGEIALRFNSINFKIRLEFNKTLCHRYQMTKSALQKKNGNKVFNTQKIGNIFEKGYFKIVPNIFEGDRNGFFAGIFSKGVYMFEEHPHEYFLERGENGEFQRGLLNDNPVMTNTTIEENFSTAIGRDDLVHVDDMSWVWKDSYCRPAGGSGELPADWRQRRCGNSWCSSNTCAQMHHHFMTQGDLFPQLIEGMRHNIKVDDNQAWKFDGYSSGQSEATLQQGVQYEWYMHAFSSGQQDSRSFRGLDDGVKVILKQDGADWELSFIGRVEITETIGNPDAIGSGLEINDYEETLPEMEDESQTEGLEEAEKSMEPEAEEQKDNDQEKSEELEQQAEPEAQKEDEKQEELEQETEDEKSKDKQKQKQKQKQKETEQEQQEEAEHSGEQEK